MKKNKKEKTIIMVFAIILIVITIYNIYVMYKNIEISTEYETKKTSLSTNYEENVDNYTKKEDSIEGMLEKTTKSVVGISKLINTGGSILNNISSDELGLGTGIIVGSNGYILSNSHVTGEKYSNCYITIDENNYKGTVVWSDLNLDLSIVKIQAENLNYIEIGDSENIKVGNKVFAIGNPIGYEFRKTVTSGIISAVNRTIKIDENDIIELKKMFNRNFTKGFMLNEDNNNFTYDKRPNNIGIEVGQVISKVKNDLKIKLTYGVSVHDGLRILDDKEDKGLVINKMFINNKHDKNIEVSGKGTDIKESQSTTETNNTNNINMPTQTTNTSTNSTQTTNKVEITDWKLRLANYDNLLPEDFEVELANIDNSKDPKQFDARAVKYLKDMINAMKKDGNTKIWCQSTFRSVKRQKELYDASVQKYLKQGKKQEEADKLTLEYINKPGGSDHNLGLAVDFNYVDNSFAKTSEYKWLLKNAENYGFILRYPEDKEDKTKIAYESWHWR